MGIRMGSPLKSGRTRTWMDCHGPSFARVAARLGVEAAGMARAMVEEAAAEREGAMEGRWARLPRRCISRETSLAS